MQYFKLIEFLALIAIGWHLIKYMFVHIVDQLIGTPETFLFFGFFILNIFIHIFLFIPELLLF